MERLGQGNIEEWNDGVRRSPPFEGEDRRMLVGGRQVGGCYPSASWISGLMDLTLDVWILSQFLSLQSLLRTTNYELYS